MKTRHLVLGFVALGCVAGAAWLGREKVAHVAPRVAEALGGKHVFREQWAKGTAYAYRFEWSEDATVRTEGLTPAASSEAMHGDGALKGELTLRCLGEREGASILAASFGSLTEHRMNVMGSDPLKDESAVAKTFDGQEAYVAIEPTGGVRAMWFKPESSALFKGIARAVLSDLQTTIPGDERVEWTTNEPGPSGRADAAYTIGESAITRSRTRYTTLSALPPSAAEGHDEQLTTAGKLTLTDDGALATVDDDEVLVARAAGVDGPPNLQSHSTFSLALTGTSAFDAPTEIAFDARMQPWHPGDVDAPASDGHELERLAAGVTIDSLEENIAIVSVGGAPPKGFVQRAVAFLKLHPEACDELAVEFENPEIRTRGHEMVADLLAGAGHDRAQAALRKVLSSDTARRSDDEYVSLLQRISLVNKPSTETVAFVRDAYAQAQAAGRADDTRAAAYTLGSTAGNLASHGDTGAASAIVDSLTRDLGRAKDAKDKSALLAAIGNAGGQDSEKVIASYATDEDAHVRRQAAASLRKVDSDDARAELVTMLSDEDPSVSRAAIDSFSQQPLEPSDVSRFAAVVAHAGLPAGTEHDVLTFFGNHMTPAADVEGALTAMLARTHDDYRTTLRIQQLLAQVRGESQLPTAMR